MAVSRVQRTAKSSRVKDGLENGEKGRAEVSEELSGIELEKPGSLQTGVTPWTWRAQGLG